MKNLKVSFWLALAATGMFLIQIAGPLSGQKRLDDPMPTCPPECPKPKLPKPKMLTTFVH
jgi:hypothetical protein